VSSGFRLYRREALDGIDLRAANFDVLEEVLINILTRGWEIREIPFHYQPRQEGRSKARLLAFGWSFVRSFRRMRQLRWSAPLARRHDTAAPDPRSVGTDSWNV